MDQEKNITSLSSTSTSVPQIMISVICQLHDSMRACVRLDDRVCSRWSAVEQGLRQGCVLAPLLFNIHLLRGGYKLGLHAFQGGQRHHGRFGTPEVEKGGGGKQLSASQSSRRRFGVCFTLTMPGSPRNHPSS